jgi:hypothetical protein
MRWIKKRSIGYRLRVEGSKGAKAPLPVLVDPAIR